MRPLDLRLVRFRQPRKNGAEVEPCLGRADPAKVVDAPNHAGGTNIEAGVAVTNSFVERVRRPESLGIEMFKPIRNDVLDCGGGLALPPWDGSQWHVTSMFDHEPSVSQNLICPMINSRRRGNQFAFLLSASGPSRQAAFFGPAVANGALRT